MPQLSLFEPSTRVLADDPRGRIEYIPRFVTEDTASAWFAELQSEVS
jgi:hypothetical protein